MSHDRAVALALRTSNELKRLFNRLGNVDHPNGRILAAYRQARRALKGNIGNQMVVLDALRELRQAIAETVRSQLQEAQDAGIRQATTELALYGLPNTAYVAPSVVELGAVMATFDGQAAQVRGLALQGDESMILGDATRVGALGPGIVTREAAKWLATVAISAWSSVTTDNVERVSGQEDFLRQAVAAVDKRTTDCCLRVNGQTVGMNEPFHLTGTPRYADYQMMPPYHDRCRTAQALVRRREASDDITQRLKATARAELGRR